MADLCSIQDVKGSDDENVLQGVEDEDINSRIEIKSLQVMTMAMNQQLTSEDKNAKFACVYNVLRSFQISSLDPSSTANQQISSKKEGDLQVNYTTTQTSSSTSNPSTYNDWFWFFMNRLIPQQSRPCPISSVSDPDYR